jgi:hypothetical protein
VRVVACRQETIQQKHLTLAPHGTVDTNDAACRAWPLHRGGDAPEETLRMGRGRCRGCLCCLRRGGCCQEFTVGKAARAKCVAVEGGVESGNGCAAVSARRLKEIRRNATEHVVSTVRGKIARSVHRVPVVQSHDKIHS